MSFDKLQLTADRGMYVISKHHMGLRGTRRGIVELIHNRGVGSVYELKCSLLATTNAAIAKTTTIHN